MHKNFMQAALDEARLGRGICAPNPSVGAVLVHQQCIIARAFHLGPGHAHAEQRVLEQAPGQGASFTLYVTLEPCNHWGRTPPCVDAIIKHGIKTVVFGFLDPNPLVAKNNTSALLQEQGIEVIHYPLPEIDLFYQSYQHWLRTQKPWVTAKLAQSLDGKIAGPEGKPVTLSNEECAQFTHEQRRQADIILTSSATILADNPKFTARLENQAPQDKNIAIVDRNLQLSGQELLFKQAKHCHIFHDNSVVVKHPLPHCTYHATPAYQGLLCLDSVIKVLGGLGHHDVWVEAGGKLFSALHENNLVNTSYFYLVPKVLGETAVSAYHSVQIFKNKHRIQWHPQADNIIMQVNWERLEDSCLQA